jgi:diguanylate cyclase (GGDEF)-like protein
MSFSLRSLVAAALTAAWLASAPAAPAQPASAAADKTEIERLVDDAQAALRTQPEQLFELTNRALALLATRPDPDLEAQVRALRCEYFNERDRVAAQREIELIRALLPKLSQPGIRAAMLACEGELYEQESDNTRAMALYEQAVGVAEAAHDERRLANVLFLRGYLRGVTGDYARGLADLQRALALFQKLGLAPEARTTVNGVAGLYSRMGALEEARHFYEDALRALPEVASRERVVAQHNLGRNLQRAGRWDDAQRQFEQVLAQSRELHFVRGQVYALRGLAAVRNAKGDARRALQFADEALRLGAHVPDEPVRAGVLVQRAAALRQLGRPAEAQAAVREAIRIYVAGDAVAEEGEARAELARIAAAQGEWREAYEQQSRSSLIAEDLLRQQIDNRFAAMKVQFDADAKAREVALLQRENEASERALAEQRRATRLQIVATALASALALLLAGLAWRQRQASRHMRALAMTDELTGLPNRRRALAALDAAIANGSGAALLILDIDHFKRINDRHGHAVGDSVLRAITAAWRQQLGPEVTLGRLGGEEFVAVLPGASLAQGRELAERLRRSAAAVDLSGWLAEQRLTTSVGVTALAPGDTVAAALARADIALYRAKEGGRDRVEALA